MRIYRKEFGNRYETYEFGYSLWAEREKKDTLADMYNQGFLPYSGDLDINHTYYMSRGSRVRLKDFAFSSENRRIWKKFGEGVERTEVNIEEKLKEESFIDFCVSYFDEKHGKDIFTEERLRYVFTFSKENTLFEYTYNGKVAGYVLEVTAKDMRHFWFSFYDLALTKQSFGAFLMLHAIKSAKNEGFKYMYLGNVYGEKALYKTNYQPLEFWNGNDWVDDKKALRALAKRV